MNSAFGVGTRKMELGIYSFGELGTTPFTGATTSPAQRLSDLIEEIELADQVGLDVFGIGEHHRPDFVVSAPAVVLAAASQRTKNIRLSSAVSVISSDDPVRVFEEFSTLDLLSKGRAEIMAGRGSFIESFPLFGYDLADYDSLFDEKLRLLLEIRENEIVSWAGRHRAEIAHLGVYPRPYSDFMPIWIAVGGTPESVLRAGTLGLPMGLAIIGGVPRRFARLIGLYREAAKQAGHDSSSLPLGINLHAYIADTTERAVAEFYPSYTEVMTKLGKERGWPPVTREQFDASRGPDGALVLGSTQEVTDKLLALHEVFQNTRFLLKFSVGAMPHSQIMHAIELFGTEVAPRLRKAAMLQPAL